MRGIRRFLRYYQSFVISGAVIFVTLISIFVGIIPGANRAIKILQSLQETIKTVDQLQQKTQVLESLDETTLEVQAKSALTAVPTDKSLGSIFSTIDGLTAREGVIVTSVSLDAIGSVATDSAKKSSSEEQKLGVTIIPFSIVVEGPLPNVRNVVDTAVKIRRLFRVRNFDLSIDSKTGTVRSTISMEAYYVPLPKFMTKPTERLDPLLADEEATMKRVELLPLLTPIGVPSNVVITPDSATTKDPFSP